MKANYFLLAASIAGWTTPLLASDAPDQASGARDAAGLAAPAAPAAPASPAAPAAPAAPASISIIDAGAITHLSVGQAIKNAPYSAEIVSERLQHLADGNQIANRSVSLSWRDSAGRTRLEVRGADGAAKTVTIDDPVARERWILDPQRKSATRIALAPEMARAHAEQARAQAEQARAAATAARAAAAQARLTAQQEREVARQAALEARQKIEQLRKEGKLPEGRQLIVKEIGRGGEPKEIRVRVAEPVPAVQAVPAMSPQATARLAAQIGPMIASASADARWAAATVTRELGTRDFFGVPARGVQSSYQIPAGAIGNRQPITVSSETWTAPTLQIVVYHKRSDPRSGELVYQLARLDRTEPAAALFALPQGYTVRDPLRPSRTAREARD